MIMIMIHESLERDGGVAQASGALWNCTAKRDCFFLRGFLDSEGCGGLTTGSDDVAADAAAAEEVAGDSF